VPTEWLAIERKDPVRPHRGCVAHAKVFGAGAGVDIDDDAGLPDGERAKPDSVLFEQGRKNRRPWNLVMRI
jgi:hypothetical protein